MILTLPFPPSLNKIKQPVRTGRHMLGRMALTSEARAYKQEVAVRCVKAKLKPLKNAVRVHLELWMPDWRYRDTDNYDKLICDGMQGYAYLNDAQIVKREVTKHYPPHPPGEVRVIIEEMPGWVWKKPSAKRKYPA